MDTYIDLQEFMDEGFLQEANRNFFHPLGLALEMGYDEDGKLIINGIWDYRNDPEGIIFAPGSISGEKIRKVKTEREKHINPRMKLLGSYLQYPEDDPSRS